MAHSIEPSSTEPTPKHRRRGQHPRRDFLKTTIALALAGGPFGALASSAPRRTTLRANSKLAVAKIGCGGMGGGDLEQVARHADVTIVGLCDVDGGTLQRVGKDDKNDKGNDPYKDVPKFQDWREMFAKLDDRFDAVVVSTPDHTHAIISLDAIKRDKHVYTQKPLARAASENRALAAAAKAKPSIVTQMGTQRSAVAERRLSYDLVRKEVVGKIRAMHAWTDRPAGWWPCGQPRPSDSDPVPADLAWDVWLGPAPNRPYKKGVYAPFHWRGTRDFGTGAFGDMACHIMDMPYYGLDLALPIECSCDAPDGTDDQFPNQETVLMKFAPTARTASNGLDFTWYDGGRLPDFKAIGLPETLAPSDRGSNDEHGCLPLPKDGAAILVGEGGLLVIPIQGQFPYAFIDGKRRDFENTFATTNHWHDWVDACLGRGKARAPFETAAVMCEALALGAIASRYATTDAAAPRKTLKYDAAKFAFTDGSGTVIEGSEAYLHPTPRAGW
ncbi:MAG: Gfo/Idh/MocA family oxidoreductase [Phycisphaerae bacterium]|mgnify:CR=1 FL=1|nr:Gfo/Idh/MocA family oxidoreductase [Phycisphaerae bacterium]